MSDAKVTECYKLLLGFIISITILMESYVFVDRLYVGRKLLCNCL